MKKRRSYYVATQLNLNMAISVILGLLITGSILIYVSSHVGTHQLRNAQQAKGQVISEQINNYIDDLQRKLNYLARVPGLTKFTKETQYNLLRGLIYHNKAYEWVGLTDRYGNLQQKLSSTGNQIPQMWKDTIAFRRSVHEHEDYISPIEISSQHSWPTLLLSVPVRDERNQVDGMLFARINLKYLWAVLNGVKVGKTGYVYLVDQRKFVVASSNDEHKGFVFEDISQHPVSQLLFSFEGSDEPEIYKGLRDVKVLGTISPVFLTNWFVVIELPLREAFSPRYQLLIILSVCLFFGLLFSLLLGTMLAHKVIRPLSQLTEAAQGFSDGDFDTRIEVTQNNELGILSEAFNYMAERLSDTINDLKHRMETLNQYNHIVSSSTDLMALLNQNFVYIAANLSYCNAFQLKPEELIGSSSRDIFGEDFFEKVIKPHAVACLEGKPVNHSSWFHFPGVGKRYMEINYYPYTLAGGEIKGFVVNGRDITDRKRTKEALFKKNKELENYLYVASHDLKTPLVNIQGFSQRLQKQVNIIKKSISADLLKLESRSREQVDKIMDEGVPQTLDFIFSNVEKIDNLINGLLQISRTGRVKISPQNVNIKQLFEKIIRSLTFQIEKSNGKVTIEDLPDCYGDAVQLNQLFSNIITNALKYRDKSRPLIISISGKIDHEKVIYKIEDTGIGIEQKNLEKIWDVFYRVDPLSAEAGEGIGLSIVKRISEKHKGDVRVESEKGKGSSFYIELHKDFFSEELY